MNLGGSLGCDVLQERLGVLAVGQGLEKLKSMKKKKRAVKELKSIKNKKTLNKLLAFHFLLDELGRYVFVQKWRI
jgi:hypothetical protein